MGFLSRLRRRTPVDLDERSSELGLKYGDLLVLEQLVRAGGDLRAPRHVVYYLYFDDVAAARAAGTEAQGRGFGTEVREPLPGASSQSTLVCDRHGYVLEPDVVRENTDFFDELALRHGGDYDGWEASVA